MSPPVGVGSTDFPLPDQYATPAWLLTGAGFALLFIEPADSQAWL
jgi:hypothetical protein